MSAGVHEDMAQAFLTGVPLPVILRPAVPISDNDLLLFSSRNPLYRIERNARGELEIMTPVGGDSGRWEALVIAALAVWTEEHGGVSFSSNAGFSLKDGSVLSPDAAWISEERWNALTNSEQRSFPPICPEFLIEVLSANDSRHALEAKMGTWMSNGAKLAWLIDARSSQVIVYRPGAEATVLDRPEWVEANEPVDGFRLRTCRFWTKL